MLDSTLPFHIIPDRSNYKLIYFIGCLPLFAR